MLNEEKDSVSEKEVYESIWKKTCCGHKNQKPLRQNQQPTDRRRSAINLKRKGLQYKRTKNLFDIIVHNK